MSDEEAEDNRFASVARTLEDADEDEVDADESGATDGKAGSPTDTVDPEPSTASEPDVDAGVSTGVPAIGPGARGDDPAFPFRDVTQYPFYARKESWRTLDAAWQSIAPVLEGQGVTGIERREIHDAALRVAASDPAALAAAIARARTDAPEE